MESIMPTKAKRAVPKQSEQAEFAEFMAWRKQQQIVELDTDETDEVEAEIAEVEETDAVEVPEASGLEAYAQYLTDEDELRIKGVSLNRRKRKEKRLLDLIDKLPKAERAKALAKLLNKKRQTMRMGILFSKRCMHGPAAIENTFSNPDYVNVFIPGRSYPYPMAKKDISKIIELLNTFKG